VSKKRIKVMLGILAGVVLVSSIVVAMNPPSQRGQVSTNPLSSTTISFPSRTGSAAEVQVDGLYDGVTSDKVASVADNVFVAVVSSASSVTRNGTPWSSYQLESPREVLKGKVPDTRIVLREGDSRSAIAGDLPILAGRSYVLATKNVDGAQVVIPVIGTTDASDPSAIDAVRANIR
jgi:hypothetical protein